MMEPERRYKVLIVEDEPRYSEPLKSCFNQSVDFVTMAVTDSEAEALTLVKSGLPDAMVVDLQLYNGEGDGMLLLHHIYDLKQILPLRPYIVVLTSVVSERIKERLSSGLADFSFSKRTKNYTPELILRHLRAMSSEFDCNRTNRLRPLPSILDKEALIYERVEREICHYYVKHGNQAKDFLVDAICMTIALPEYEKPVFQHIFAEIAKKHGKSHRNVYTRIHLLLQQAFAKTDANDLAKVYTPYLDVSRAAPTPREFIAYTANKIRREHIV